MICGAQDCEAEIDWALSAEGDARRMPVVRDSAGEPDGTLAVWRDGDGILRYRNLAAGTGPGPGEKRGRSHFKDCTDPGRYSGRNRRQP
jgi:hypothetical protein